MSNVWKRNDYRYCSKWQRGFVDRRKQKPQRITSKLFVHSKANAERCDDCEIVVIKEEK